MSKVWSCNEWDQLEEVIVGNPLNARFPTADRSTQVAEFHDRSLSEIPRGSFPQKIVEETEEDLKDFVAILEGLGITVKRPKTWPPPFTRRLGFPARLPGTTRRNGRTTCTVQTQLRGLFDFGWLR